MKHPSDEKHRVAALLARLDALAGPRSWELAGGQVRVSTPATAGDDCAVIELTGAVSLVCGADYVRGAKFALFELGLLDYRDLGYYVAAANLSDIAAMGGQPIGILTIVRYPPDLADDDFDAIIAGAQEAATRYGCELLGGDTGGAERLILSASALGVCEPGTALLRSGAQPDDILCLTGSVGAPAAALLHFSGRKTSSGGRISGDEEQALLQSWKRPEPRVPQGRLLAARHLASACQDISDGLRTTADELAAASGVRLTLDEAAIPIDHAVELVAREARVDSLALAMSASVDFELLFTVSPDKFDACQSAFESAGFELHRIGEASEGEGTALRRADGSQVELPGVAWRHQQEDVVEMLRRDLDMTGENEPVRPTEPKI